MENLDLVSNHKSYQEKAYEKWRFRFETSLSLTWILPLLLLGAQFAFVGNQINYDVMKLSNWVGVEAVFALPIRFFVLMVTITTLLGLYARSLQFSEQLRLSNAQQRLAFEQLKLAQQQSSRLESQLSLYIKKENFSLYHEHIKRFESKLNSLLFLSKQMFRLSTKVESDSLVINTERLYSYTFPENSYNELKNANLKSDNFIFGEGFAVIDLDTLIELDISLEDVELEQQIKHIVQNIFNIGIVIKTHTNSGEDFDIRVFAIDVYRALFIMRLIGLISDEHYNEVTSSCNTYVKSLFG